MHYALINRLEMQTDQNTELFASLSVFCFVLFFVLFCFVCFFGLHLKILKSSYARVERDKYKNKL